MTPEDKCKEEACPHRMVCIRCGRQLCKADSCKAGKGVTYEGRFNLREGQVCCECYDKKPVLV